MAIHKHAAELWTKQKGRCWICKGPIPSNRPGTRVDLKHNYHGGKPTLGQLGLSCQSCVTGRYKVAKPEKPAAPKPGIQVRMSRV